MKHNYNSIAIVIPSLEPTNTLITCVEQLRTKGFIHIIVINDGSDDGYNTIFNEVETLHQCTVLHHPQNLGKGAALKTGYAYINEYLPACTGVVTADSDGQHSTEDVCRIAQALNTSKPALLLGSRNFNLPAIPIKSRVGNRLSSCIFFCLQGKWIGDTQTGLRGFHISLVEKMLEIKGERFEYEMEVLTACVSQRIPIEQIPIQTIYENDNSGTHFKACRDSIRIAKVLLKSIMRFSVSSLASAFVDLGLAWFFMDLFANYFVNRELLIIGGATVIARIISMLVNYSLNKKVVFENNTAAKQTFTRYIILCGVIMVLSTLFVYSTHTLLFWNKKIAKVVGDGLLFILSYQAQKRWVFGDID